MRILICSYVFRPSIGGIETVSKVLAEQFSSMGASVTVVTHTPGDGHVSGGYEVVRRPPVSKLRALAHKSDIILQSQISLHTLLPLLFCGKPIVIAHHVVWNRAGGIRGTWQQQLKRLVMPFCNNLAVSRAVAGSLPVKSTVIGNPFEADEFTVDGETNRDKDIVFLGRLVDKKGCDVALRALAILRNERLRPSFTVIGDGPEMPMLKRLSQELGIAGQVDFRGAMREERGREVARHKIMVIPSTYDEAFPLVAFEGLAAGCVLVAAEAGGLPEGVGPCGLLFPLSDAEALAAALRRLLTEDGLRERLLGERTAHLERFQPEKVARRYMGVFKSVLEKRRG